MTNCVNKKLYYAKLNCLKFSETIYLCKKISSGLFKNVIFWICFEIIYSIYRLKRFDIRWPTMVDMP